MFVETIDKSSNDICEILHTYLGELGWLIPTLVYGATRLQRIHWVDAKNLGVNNLSTTILEAEYH